ncbi:MAG: lipid-A-disaccharide synthase [Gammaproteobacteria bacterium]|nr:lipid-A-disaccharide synthase [Gammaproteobacteria bacterium]MDH5303343.1 lipid-A-disaccharide synthase [Gammaproteobacteria bacterium]MDH5322463.1 lipid-A-disaccharide synthase [Gammaproteobacteria bacterium]
MRIALVAGEASGDLLGAGLIRAVREKIPGAQFQGVAGPAMIAAGCERLADSESLAVMGLIEPLAEIPKLLRLRRALTRRWQASPPDVFVGIDAPDFNLGLEKALRKSGIPTVHYVCPSIWAWRAGRIKTIRKAADRVLCILPFEKKILDAQGVDAVFVGHPKADHLATDIDAESARRILDLDGRTVIAVLPGSRKSEVTRLGPVFVAAAAILAQSDEQLRFVTPVAAPRLRPLIEAQIAAAGMRDRFTLIDGDSIEAMSAAHVVLLASGTAALESALLCKPMVAAYRVAEITARILDIFGLVKTPYFTLPNLLTEEPLVPELIQWAVTPDAVAAAVQAMLADPERRAAIAGRFAKLRVELALDADRRAADAVIDLATRTGQHHPTP